MGDPAASAKHIDDLVKAGILVTAAESIEEGIESTNRDLAWADARCHSILQADPGTRIGLVASMAGNRSGEPLPLYSYDASTI